MLSSKGAACKVTARIGLRSKSDCGVCYKLNRQRTVILESPRIGWSLKAKGTMAYPDFELLRLEEVLRLARDRPALIIRMVPDPAVLRAAEGLCAEAAASLRLYRTKAS
jgi:hypothetical protein